MAKDSYNVHTLDNLVNATEDKLPETISVSKSQLKTILQVAFSEIQSLTSGGDYVRIHNFGTFANKVRAARAGRNPATGEVIQIAESVTLGFKPTKHGK